MFLGKEDNLVSQKLEVCLDTEIFRDIRVNLVKKDKHLIFPFRRVLAAIIQALGKIIQCSLYPVNILDVDDENEQVETVKIFIRPSEILLSESVLPAEVPYDPFSGRG